MLSFKIDQLNVSLKTDIIGLVQLDELHHNTKKKNPSIVLLKFVKFEQTSLSGAKKRNIMIYHDIMSVLYYYVSKVKWSGITQHST